MKTPEALRRQIKTAKDLHSVVRTMKALAAVKINELQQAVQSLAQYNRTVNLGLRVALRNRPEGVPISERARTDRLGAVVFGSDQGMCGQFNEEIAHHALRELQETNTAEEPPALLCVGARAEGRLLELGLEVEETFPAPASIGGIAPVITDLLFRIESWREERQIDRAVLYYNMQVSTARYKPRTLAMLPLNPEWLETLEAEQWPSRSLPQFTMDWTTLFASLVREYLLVSLYRAAAESQASENAARLASMQAADKNIEDRLAELQAEYHHVRQTSITEELLDIVSGFEALTSEDEGEG